MLSTNRRHDLIKKKRAYHTHEVGHDWIIDPVEETLAVHRWHPDGYVEVLVADCTERVRAEPFDAIELDLANLWLGLPLRASEPGEDELHQAW